MGTVLSSMPDVQIDPDALAVLIQHALRLKRSPETAVSR